uniref:Uncharacterized protein n=1 Tax=Kalanchoe fedtschenkoi TaxID=63787 RepID=A0A7N0UPI6_KALFE
MPGSGWGEHIIDFVTYTTLSSKLQIRSETVPSPGELSETVAVNSEQFDTAANSEPSETAANSEPSETATNSERLKWQ